MIWKTENPQKCTAISLGDKFDVVSKRFLLVEVGAEEERTVVLHIQEARGTLVHPHYVFVQAAAIDLHLLVLCEWSTSGGDRGKLFSDHLILEVGVGNRDEDLVLPQF